MPLPTRHYSEPSADKLPAPVEEVTPPASAPKFFKIIALGDLPLHRERIENGQRVIIAPPYGEVPPTSITQHTSEGKQVGDPVSLRLHSRSPLIPTKSDRVILHEFGSMEPWCSFMMSDADSALTILWHDVEDGDWTEVNNLVLPNDKAHFPAKSIRFTNVSQHPVGISFRGKTTKLAAGKSVVKFFLKDGNHELEVRIKNENGKWIKKIFHNEIVHENGHDRTEVIFYEVKSTYASVRVWHVTEPTLF